MPTTCPGSQNLQGYDALRRAGRSSSPGRSRRFLPPSGAVTAPAGRAASDSFEDNTMPATHSSKTLYRIDECPDLMADGCVGDENGNLVFLSIWARDTAVQEFLARLTLGRDEQGLDQFHVITDQDASVPVFVGNVENLEKRITRAYRRTLFGSLTNVWLLVRDTCPLPLLDHWRDIVLELLQARTMLTRLPFALGPLEGHRLAIDVPALTQALGSLIRSNVLTTAAAGHPIASDLPLEAVA